MKNNKNNKYGNDEYYTSFLPQNLTKITFHGEYGSEFTTGWRRFSHGDVLVPYLINAEECIKGITAETKWKHKRDEYQLPPRYIKYRDCYQGENTFLDFGETANTDIRNNCESVLYINEPSHLITASDTIQVKIFSEENTYDSGPLQNIFDRKTGQFTITSNLSTNDNTFLKMAVAINEEQHTMIDVDNKNEHTISLFNPNHETSLPTLLENPIDLILNDHFNPWQKQFKDQTKPLIYTEIKKKKKKEEMKITIVTKSGRVYEESGERLVSILNDKRDWYGIYTYTEYDPHKYKGEACYRGKELLLQVNAMEIECIDYREEEGQ